VLERLVRDGVLVRAHDSGQKRDVLFHRDAVATAQSRLRTVLVPPGLLVSEIGAALGISRKYSVPLLEHLDATGFTRRLGNRRVLARPG
jgi:selenocysteine-specific elongation factor